MLDFLFDYGLFLAKTLTVVVAVLAIILGFVAIASRGKRESAQGDIQVMNINEAFDDMREAIESVVVDKELYKQQLKLQQKKEKKEAKEKKKQAKLEAKKNLAVKKEAVETVSEAPNKRVFVIDFNGDVRASEVDFLREEVSAILAFASKDDEVVLRLESAGGMVHTYGLAASQLQRIKSKNIKLTVCVDEVAASGGYMMACIADRLIAAPFAIVGSIGVVAQVPNFHRVLKKHDVDYELFAAGEHKRTVTMFGENTEKGKQKFSEDIQDTHELFKSFVAQARPVVDLEKVATGEVWFGQRALEQQLVDELNTSDDFLMSQCEHAEVYQVRYEVKKSLGEKIGDIGAKTSGRVFDSVLQKLADTRSFIR
ncbi:MAG: protease SohB [Pseudomonadales bacterium]